MVGGLACSINPTQRGAVAGAGSIPLSDPVQDNCRNLQVVYSLASRLLILLGEIVIEAAKLLCGALRDLNWSADLTSQALQRNTWSRSRLYSLGLTRRRGLFGQNSSHGAFSATAWRKDSR